MWSKIMTWIIFFTLLGYSNGFQGPSLIQTWSFQNSALRALEILNSGGSVLDAISDGISVCEEEQCDGTVGYGGSPDENSETSLDAMIMDGETHNVGAVGNLRRIKSAIRVARKVLENTLHSFLVGESATQFAISLGFKEESLTTPYSKSLWKNWRGSQNCQPNFWRNVVPDPSRFCGPYSPKDSIVHDIKSTSFGESGNHDTIGMVAIDSFSKMASGTSTNGARFKIPGRIGDSPIPGSGSYVDSRIGGAAATGDGDIMLRFLPSFLAVEEMRRGAIPELAAQIAIKRIAEKYPSFKGGVVALRRDGIYGAACHGFESFPYVIGNETGITSLVVECLKN